MLKRLFIIITVILILTSCAKRNTAYQEDDVLTLVKQIPVVGNPSDISFDDQYIYIAQDQGGLSMIKADNYGLNWWTNLIPDSADSQLVNIRKVYVVSEHKLVFLAEFVASDKIRIVNYSNPDSLRLIDSITGGTDGLNDMKFKSIETQTDTNIIEGFFTAGRTINYCRYNGEVYMGIDYFINTPATASGIDFNENYIFVAAQQRGLLIYDRASRQLISELAIPGEAQKIQVFGNYAYIASRQGGLNVVNIADPAVPLLANTFDTSGYATTIDVNGSMAVVSSGSGGVYLFDLSSPGNPVLKQRLSSAGYTNNARFRNGKIIVASRDQGVLFYDIK